MPAMASIAGIEPRRLSYLRTPAVASLAVGDFYRKKMAYSEKDIKQMLGQGGARIKSIDGKPIKQSTKGAAGKKEKRIPLALSGKIRAGRVLRLELMLPIQVISEANQRDHWTVKHARVTAQQQEVEGGWMAIARGVQIQPPCRIRLTRIGRNLLDSDNLAGAFKAVRDKIAAIIGIDDGCELLTWEYDQQTTDGDYAIKIEFTCQ